MRRIIFLMSAFFLFSLFSCSFSSHNEKEEQISVLLPNWPPEDKSKKLYPPLSHWKITVRSQTLNTTIFYTPSSQPFSANGINIANNKISLMAAENQPLAITSTPITNAGINNVMFFKPAGFLYPYNKEKKLTWNEGFLATIMTSIFQADSSGAPERNNFIRSFNWGKASEIIKEKIETQGPLYNPWLLNKELISNKICKKDFTATYLNLSSVYLVETNTLAKGGGAEGGDKIFLSSFPPGNNYLGQVLVKKSQIEDFMVSPTMKASITYISSKNVSLDYSFLPIFIEGL